MDTLPMFKRLFHVVVIPAGSAGGIHGKTVKADLGFHEGFTMDEAMRNAGKAHPQWQAARGRMGRAKYALEVIGSKEIGQ